jgi:PglZ domain.
VSKTLQQYIYDYVQQYLQRRPGAWLVWCDPTEDWKPLLQRVANAQGMKGFSLVSVSEQTAGEFGSPLARRQIQERLAAGESFVLHVTTAHDQLGWLWAQALLAEHIQTASLRQQLLTWGWRPQSISTTEEEIARLARQHLNQDPAEWGGGKMLPEPAVLLNLLSGGPLYPPTPEEQDEDARKDKRMILDLTVEKAGLPPINEEQLERWRLEALARLLVTQAQRVAPDRIGKHDYLIAEEKRKFARELLDRWLDSVTLRKELPRRILEADQILGLGAYFSAADLQQEPFLSQAIERALFAGICARLAEKRGRDLLEDFAALYDIFVSHAEGFWSDQQSNHPQAVAWGELARLSLVVQKMLDIAPRRPWTFVTDALQWYTEQGWQVEQAGEEIMRHLDHPTTDLLTFITPLREAYNYHWENYLLQWSDLWQQSSCPLPSYSTQGEWLKEQLKETRPTAVIFIDALRYDIGMALKQLVNKRQGAERVTVEPARTSLPTITAVGMGVALPIAENELHADIVNGKWQLYQQGNSLNLSIAEQRREWLCTQFKLTPDALLTLDKKGAPDLPKAKGKKARLFLFDTSIDKLGHDDELEPLGTQTLQERYATIIDQLHDQGWIRVLIVTDHGFIHWPGMGERRLAVPVPEPAYSSRRALAYPVQTHIEASQGLAPGGEWRVVVPSGTACFRTYGGLGYFHGGASLQEWIVPCLKIEWPVKARPVEITIQPVAHILSLRHKIILEVQHKSLFDNNDQLTREVEIIVRDNQHKQILFRSQRVIVMPDQTQVPLVIEPEDNVEAERGTKMTIELRDVRTNEIIATQTTVLMVDLENW